MFLVAILVRTVRVVRGSCLSSRVFVVILTANCAKTANKKGIVPCRFKAVRGRVQGKFSPPLQGGNESSEGRRGPCSCRSRCSRFMFLKGSVPCRPGEVFRIFPGAEKRQERAFQREGFFDFFSFMEPTPPLPRSYPITTTARCEE